MNARLMQGPSRKRTNKYEKTAAEFAEFKENFYHCKVPKGLHTREVIISNNKRKMCSLLLRNTAILTDSLTIIILMSECLVSEYKQRCSQNPRSHFNCNFQCPLNFYWNGRNYRKPAIKLTVMLSHLLCSWNFLTERMQNLECVFEVLKTNDSFSG